MARFSFSFGGMGSSLVRKLVKQPKSFAPGRRIRVAARARPLPYPAEPVRTLEAIHMASASAARSTLSNLELLSLVVPSRLADSRRACKHESSSHSDIRVVVEGFQCGATGRDSMFLQLLDSKFRRCRTLRICGLPTHGYMPTTVSANQEVHAL